MSFSSKSQHSNIEDCTPLVPTSDQLIDHLDSDFDAESMRAIKPFFRSMFHDLLSNNIRKLLDGFIAGLDLVIPHTSFWLRYAGQNTENAQLMSEYLVDRFLTDSSRVFIQASTTTLRIGTVVAQRQIKNLVLLTNSAFLPVMAVRERVPYQVHVFSAPMFDEYCGGWLFGTNDQKSRSDFCRQINELDVQDGFVSPIAAVPGAGFFFVREETTLLVRELLKKISRVILILPIERLYNSTLDLPDVIGRWTLNFDGNELQDKEVVLVTCGKLTDSHSRLLTDFRDSGINVHHCQKPAAGWAMTSMGENRQELNETEMDNSNTRLDNPHANPIKHATNDIQFLKDVLCEATEFFYHQEPKPDIRKDLKRFWTDIVMLNEILKAFRQHGKVAGPDGVAKSLKLSRNAVYLKLKHFGLEPADFQQPDVTLRLLYEKSQLCKTLSQIRASQSPAFD